MDELQRRMKISYSHAAKRPEFCDRVNKTDQCWEWTGAKGRYGYGKLKVGSHVTGNYGYVYAHRRAWELLVGPIPDGLSVLHHCDNPSCVKADPDPAVSHLFIGTRADNVHDRNAKGRSRPRHAHANLPENGPHYMARPKRKTNHPTGERHHNSKITREIADAIRTAYYAGEATMKALGQQYGISRPTVAQIVHGRTWTK